MTTPKLQMPELVVGQAGKELTHNQALAVLDQLAQAVVVDKDLTAPPGSPANGSMYIVAAAATGAWSGQSGKLAYWLTTVAVWTFITPADGWSVWVTDESLKYRYSGGVWVPSGIISSAAVAVGYGSGSGGTVTQVTSKTTNVTLNKPTGQITMNNAALAGGSAVSFNVINSLITTSDLITCHAIGSGAYSVECAGTIAGVAILRVTNKTAGSLSDSLLINFAIIKGSLT